MLKRLLSLVLAALIAVPAPALPAQVAPPSIERPAAHGAGDAGPALPRLAQRLSDTIPPLYMLGGDDKIAPVASFNAATDAFPSAALSFSTTSLGYIFDSAGKWTTRPNNLLTYSNTFNNAAWAKTAVSIGGTTPGPNGLTGTLIVPSAAYASHYIGQSVTTSSNAIIWAIAKGDGTYSAITLSNAPNNYVHFNLLNGAVSTMGTGWTSGGTTSLGSGWYLCWAVQQTATNFANAYFFPLDAFIANGNTPPTFTGNGTNGVYIAATGVSAVTYETTPRTGDQVITTSAAYYGPRIDYDPNTLAVKGLLIEEARTWVALWNRDLTNAVWAKTSITAAKDQTGIDGVANSASSITATGANGTVLQNITLASSQRLQSAYVKRITGSGAVSMTTDGGATWTAITVTGSWAQQTIPAQTLANPSVGFKLATSGDAIAVDFVGNETGAFATSALQTGASSVTRAADVVQFTGAALTALQGSAGSVIIQSISEASSSPAAITNVIKGTNSILYRDTTDKTGTTNGTTALLTAAAPTWSSAIRNGLAWSASGRSLGYTSGSIATDANTVSNGGTLYLGSSAGSAVESGWYQSFGLWNQRLSDAMLSTKLTVGGSYAANDNGVRFAFANDNLPVHWRIAL